MTTQTTPTPTTDTATPTTPTTTTEEKRPVPATTTDTDLSQFDDEEDFEERSGSHPWAQIISAPRMALAAIEKAGLPWGVFIPLDNAETVGFAPDDSWELVGVTLGDSDEATEGYLSRKPRFAVIAESAQEIQEKGSFGWRYVGQRYEGRGLSEAGRQHESNKEDYRAVTRRLLVFFDRQGNPLHSAPLQLTAKGAFAASLGVELKRFYSECSSAYWKERSALDGKKYPAKPFGGKARSKLIFACELGLHSESSDRNPSIYPKSVFLPCYPVEHVTNKQCIRHKRQVTEYHGKLSACMTDGEIALELEQYHLAMAKDFIDRTGYNDTDNADNPNPQNGTAATSPTWIEGVVYLDRVQWDYQESGEVLVTFGVMSDEGDVTNCASRLKSVRNAFDVEGVKALKVRCLVLDGGALAVEVLEKLTPGEGDIPF